MKCSFIVLSVILVVSSSQTCDIIQSLRVDCGYTGINQQQCLAKGCCWRSNSLRRQKQQENQIPWCYSKQTENYCKSINYSWSGGMGFDKAFYSKMYTLFQANLDIQAVGAVVAAPDFSTPGGSYYYEWMRDGALSMRIYMQLNNFDLSIVEKKMKSYVNWVRNVQTKHDPQGYDIRINPKFQLTSGQVYIGPWCRPQTDGPGLRSATLQLFADLLIKNGQSVYVSNKVIQPIKYDLDWIINNWQSDSCDLWQQLRSNDFFWGRAAYVYALQHCENLFRKLGDNYFALKCSSTKQSIRKTLDNHWTGTFMRQSVNREKDGAVVHAFSSFQTHQMTDQKIAKTIQVLGLEFCSQYTLNQAMTKDGIPGILVGRYPGDTYAGGNPWQLLTASFAKIFYQGANTLIKAKGFFKENDQKAWFQILKINEGTSINEQAKAMIKAGDAVMYRLYQHVKGDNGHIFQQIDRNSGIQKSAHDLTWSYANILSAIKERQKVSVQFTNFFKVTLE